MVELYCENPGTTFEKIQDDENILKTNKEARKSQIFNPEVNIDMCKPIFKIFKIQSLKSLSIINMFQLYLEQSIASLFLLLFQISMPSLQKKILISKKIEEYQCIFK